MLCLFKLSPQAALIQILLCLILTSFLRHQHHFHSYKIPLACCEIFFAFGVPGLAVHFDYLWHIPLQCFSYMHSCSHFSVMACPSKRCQPFVECNFMFFAQWQNTSNIAGHISAIVQSYIIVYSCRRHRVVGFSFCVCVCVCVCGCVEALGEGLQVLSWCIIHIYLLISHACTQKEALTGVANDWI